MEREFKGMKIRQNSKTGFLNLNDLLECYLCENPTSNKRLDSYMTLRQTEEFADVLRESLIDANNLNTKDSSELVLPSIEPPKVIETKRGKYGGTWVHPYLFLDFAMWLNPRFKLWAMEIIEDKLIQMRNEAGDRFKEMNQALKASGANSPREYYREANMINKLVFGNTGRGQRNSADQDQLDMLNKLQKYNGKMIDGNRSFHARQKECENFVRFYKEIK